MYMFEKRNRDLERLEKPRLFTLDRVMTLLC